MTPQPIDGTLLAAFQRFADLSQYWHKAHTPDSLAMSELQERHRLERDIPELIKRNTAFADLVSTRMFDAVAKVHAEPPREEAVKTKGTWPSLAKYEPKDTAGHIRADFEPNAPETPVAAQETASKETWRMLEANEEIMEGDEWFKGEDTWLPVSSSIGTPLFRRFEGMCRRRVTPPTPATEPPQP